MQVEMARTLDEIPPGGTGRAYGPMGEVTLANPLTRTIPAFTLCAITVVNDVWTLYALADSPPPALAVGG